MSYALLYLSITACGLAALVWLAVRFYSVMAPQFIAAKCPYCKGELPGGATKCLHCGSDVPLTADPVPAPRPMDDVNLNPTFNRRTTVIIGLILTLVVGGVVALVVWATERG